jgi:murein DD-endopeptidase MepM/ murein hydrolase activator NlpD
MKRIITFFLIFSLLTINLVPINQVSAKTLKDFKNDLSKLQGQLAENKRVTANTQAKINQKRNAIVTANKTIANNESTVESSKVKVAESEEQIKIKTADLAEVIDILQYTNNNSSEVYFDYILNASTPTDLMERQAVVEQIANHTQEELNGLAELIDENKALQAKLQKDNENLSNSITQYESQVQELEKYIDSLVDIGLDKDKEIETLQANIKMYEKAGCKDNDSIDDCYYNKQHNSGEFSRPLTSGRVTQPWGNNGHKGIDLGGNKKGTPIYAPANGTVVTTAVKQSCGGNQIYIHHTVAGKAYTSGYAHLTSIYVKRGQYVTKGTVIGTVGGDSSTFYYDNCTTGTHLHYNISYGYYLGAGENGYSKWSTFTANSKATSVTSISGFKNTRGWTWSTR